MREWKRCKKVGAAEKRNKGCRSDLKVLDEEIGGDMKDLGRELDARVEEKKYSRETL